MFRPSVVAIALAVGFGSVLAVPADAATRPDTRITAGPSGTIAEHSVTFRFRSSKRGSTFQCRMDGRRWRRCASPKTYRGLPDGDHVFRVRARRNGLADRTPAVRRFEILTPITLSQRFADAAAAFYFPDSAVVDVPASCGGTPAVDCPDGVPLAPSDQVQVDSTRSVEKDPGASSYDVAATSTVSTLDPVLVTALGADCELSIESANGVHDTWLEHLTLDFLADGGTGELRIVPSGLTISQAEVADLTVAGGFGCDVLEASLGSNLDAITDTVADQLSIQPLCAAPGPDLVAPCPGE